MILKLLSYNEEQIGILLKKEKKNFLKIFK